ncbi:TatD family hydrolase [Nitrosophilus kaiyonis]|uniref:TatD family hydrolase n=1 Tax=Nitrosophilus kaiyonis TaxID=2930200 RepID=UPI002492482C|nr:TatD family hydrolase [Nitrosophilus kaiyonis]
MIIDTHCHLDDERFKDDLDEVIKRAKEHDVKGFIIPGADPDDLERAKEISEKYDEVFFAAGVHPYEIDKFDKDYLLKFLDHPKCVAVGECGLDYYRLPKEQKEKEKIKKRQKEIFIEHIKIAKEVNKPLIVHIREASFDSREILIENGAKEVGGVLHCFNASEILLDLDKHNFYFGIGGVITFKNAKKLVNILPKIPINKILIETDSPYLTPHPYRGKRNEPYYTIFIAKKIAEILNMDFDEVCNITTENAKRLFKCFL